jgi:tetratricopeptide (TPR) repeat protein
MARVDRRRSQRTRPAAVTRRPDVVIEDTMFFPRLRRHAKWMFLFLAVAFALGFVGFGVGAGGIGIGDVFRGTAGGSGVPSISESETRIAENPRDAQAFRDLATAHQSEGNTAQAIRALESFIALRPRNVDALRELAGLYLAQAQEAQQRAQAADLRAAYLAPGANIAGAISLGGRPLDPDPITSALSTQLEQEIQIAASEAQQASAQAVATYKKMTAALPKDPNVQLELAQAAQGAGDVATAISAYERFLELAPDDPTAVEVRRILKFLRAQSTSTG